MANASATKATGENLEVVREKERRQSTGYSRVQWWRMEKAGKAPQRIILGPNAVGWLRHELQAWIAARAAERKPSRPAV